MGMHFGFIVARSDWPSLHAALEARCGVLSDGGKISPDQWFDVPSGEDAFHVASVNGTTYMLDPAMVLSAESDLITELARELSCLVVGAGGETVSGTFWLTAADGPDLRRLYFNVLATMTAPFALGDPLPSEATVDWTDIDGAGIFARIADLGLGTDVFDRGPGEAGRRVTWVRVELPEPGPISAQIDEHSERHKRAEADDWIKNISVQTRGQGGFDLTTSSAKPEREFRLRGIFKRGK
jgi:hypothetical protein